MFKWEKKGIIWSPSSDNAWAKEFGQNPNAVVLENKIRIYFSSRRRNAETKSGGYISYIFYIDVDKSNPSKILHEQMTPLLTSNGDSSSNEFDEFGTMPGSFVQIPEKKEVWLYYVGWNRQGQKPYRWVNALVVSKDNGAHFDQNKKMQIMKENYSSPYLHACPRVYRIEDGRWMMWYASGIEWYDYSERENPIYRIKAATSKDGLNWSPIESETLEPVGVKECQSSPNILKKDGLYHMFFSYRDLLGKSEQEIQYRLGHATSKDLINWSRDDSKAGLSVSSEGWDSQAVCYPHIVDVGPKTYMFYSGNQYGSAGFGYAELKS